VAFLRDKNQAVGVLQYISNALGASSSIGTRPHPPSGFPERHGHLEGLFEKTPTKASGFSP
jgi:hypothetical protein